MRTLLAETVRAIEPWDDLEARHKAGTLAWIASAAPLWRVRRPADPPQHLVAYFVVFDPHHGQVLLVDHRNAGLWLPTGGHVEVDELPSATVRREASEELSVVAEFWQPQPLFLTVTTTVGQDHGHTDVSLWYVLRGSIDQELAYDPLEFHRIRWFSLSALPRRCDPHLGRFVAKLQHAVLHADATV